jgi:hypothetical protein
VSERGRAGECVCVQVCVCVCVCDCECKSHPAFILLLLERPPVCLLSVAGCGFIQGIVILIGPHNQNQSGGLIEMTLDGPCG